MEAGVKNMCHLGTVVGATSRQVLLAKRVYKHARVTWLTMARLIFRTLAAATTAAITEESQYDLMITEPGGDKYYLLQGRALFDPGFSGV